MKRTIITSQQNEYTFENNDPIIEQWFADPEACTDIIIRQINEDKMYDPIFQGREGMTVLDLGANVGLFTMYAHDSAAKLIAVEPTPHTFSVLTELTANLPNVTRVQAAISPVNEMIPFFLNENATTNSMLNRQGTQIEVPGKTLAQLVSDHELTNVDFCKCDIEGSEMSAITPETLAPVKDIIKFWFVEVHQTNVTESAWPGNLEQNRQKLAEVFIGAGYEVSAVINDQLYAWK